MQPDYAMDAYNSGATAAAAGGMGFMTLIYWAWIIAILVGMWKLFVKAGKPGWASLIPIYNTIVMLQIVGKPIWWIILLFIPFVNLVVAIILMIELGKAFGKGAGWSIVFLLLLGAVGVLILGFGSSTYQLGTGKPAGKPATAPPTAEKNSQPPMA